MIAPRVLIVDDDDAFLQAALHYLRAAGCEVFAAKTAAAGLLLVRQERPAVVLLAADRPAWDGAAACQHYKSGGTADCRVILVSAGPLETVPGADGYLRRDVSGGELLAYVQNLVRLRQAEWAHGERVKELGCLYQLSALVEQPGLTLDALLQGTAELLPAAWQYPEIAGARILLNGQEYRTVNFQPTAWMQSQALRMHGQPAGAVEVCYREERPAGDEGPFLKEERSLLNAIAERLGRVAERLRGNEALRESETRYRRLFEAAQDGILILDADTGQITDVNPFLVKMLGHPREQLVGKALWEIGTFRDVAASQEAFAELQRAGYIRYENLPLETAGGRHVEVEFVSNIYQVNHTQVIQCNVRDITERKKAGGALQASEQKFRSLFNVLPIGVSILDEERKLLDVNPALETILNLPRAELLSGTYAARKYLRADGTPMPPEELPSVRAYEERRIVQGTEIGIVKEDGETIWVSVGAAPFPLPGLGVAVTTVDVTARKRAAEALERYAARLEIMHKIDLAIVAARSLEEIAEAALAHIQQLIPCIRASLAVLEPGADKALLIAVHATGETTMSVGTTIPLEQVWFLEGLRQGQLYVSDDLQASAEPSPTLRLLQEDGVRSYVSVPLLVKEELVGALSLGTARPSSLTPEGVAAIQELALPLAVAIQESRQRRQLEKALQQTRQDYAALVDSVDGIVWEAEAATARFQFVSKQAERLLGYPAASWLEEPSFWFDHLHLEDRDRVLAARAQAVAAAHNYALEYRMLTADGQTVWLRDIVTVLAQPGQPTRLRGVMIDVTEHKAMEEALLRSERLAAMGTLAASLAHEINNPLQSIVGSLGLAEEAVQEGQDAGRYLRVAREEIQRLRRIMGQMRELYRPEAGERELVDLNSILARVIDLCDRPCREQHVELQWLTAPGLPPFLAVADRLKQVFLNLMLNAVEAMPGGGTLQVRTLRTERPPGVQVEFQDSGVGMAPEMLEHLFEPFRSTKAAGSGLGLFVSHGIVQDHGGSITVESQLGQGTTFRVWLPVQEGLSAAPINLV